mmetsp:Transcript_13593/g.21236  ORF Transcript_13593/g.21236 Transcript_13593/m.21236 type:complete len:183 (+) Transcript_13593:272-820(+)
MADKRFSWTCLLSLAALLVTAVAEASVEGPETSLALEAGGELDVEENPMFGNRSVAKVKITPGFAARGRRAKHKFEDSDVGCEISYSAMGEHEEEWTFTIRKTPWRWICNIESPEDSKIKFTFYNVMFVRDEQFMLLDDVELWGPKGAYVRHEHFVVPQGSSVRNAAGWVAGFRRLSISAGG